jgi:hypothetical protein
MMGQKTFTANKSIRRLFSGVLRLVRSTSLVVGLAVMMALMVGVASSALAGTGIGGVFNLGKTNSVNAVTKLAGSVPGASLVVDNNSTGTGVTALDLQVEPGKAPMKVDSQTKVANLNADKLDGKSEADFYAAGSKVADSSHADQADSATSAQNADKLDGMDSTSFGRVLAAGVTGVDLPSIPGNSCQYHLVDPAIGGVDISSDVVLVTPDATLNVGQWSVAAQHSNAHHAFEIQFCNQTASALDPPATAVNWIVFDK